MGKHNYLRTNIALGLEKGKQSVDREANIIYGYSVMEKGNVKDYRAWEIDDQTLDEVVASGNKPAGGLKVRFGHPNMSSEALGTLLGRAKDFRKDGKVVRADLHLSPTAFNTPNGDLATYVMDLAEKDPGMFGTSVVLGEYRLEQRLNKDGTPQRDKNGNELPPLLRVGKLLASDVVDDPAATNGMFATQFFSESVMPSAFMTQFLDGFLSNADAVEKVINFLTRYQINEGDKKLELNQKQGDEDMDLKSLSLEELKFQRPDLCDQIKNDALSVLNEDSKKQIDEALSADRTRVVGILEFLSVEEYQPYRAIALGFIRNGDDLVKAENGLMKARFGTLKDESPDTPGPELEEQPKGEQSHLEKAQQYQSEKGCSLTDALRATAEKRKK